MRNAEFLVGDLLHGGEQGVPVAPVRGIDEDMRGKGVTLRGDGPGVDIVDEGHALKLLNVVTELVDIDVVWRAFEQHVNHTGHQAPGTDEDKQADDDADDGVGDVPAKGDDED